MQAVSLFTVQTTCLPRISHLNDGASILRDNDERPRLFLLISQKCRTTQQGGDASASSHEGDWSSGIGFAWNSFLHCLAVHRAQILDFFLRALSVEIPVPAYICR